MVWLLPTMAMRKHIQSLPCCAYLSFSPLTNTETFDHPSKSIDFHIFVYNVFQLFTIYNITFCMKVPSLFLSLQFFPRVYNSTLLALLALLHCYSLRYFKHLFNVLNFTNESQPSAKCGCSNASLFQSHTSLCYSIQFFLLSLHFRKHFYPFCLFLTKFQHNLMVVYVLSCQSPANFNEGIVILCTQLATLDIINITSRLMEVGESTLQ